jgi:type 1 fimbria pilin
LTAGVHSGWEGESPAARVLTVSTFFTQYKSYLEIEKEYFMNAKKLVLAAALSSVVAMTAQAADQGHGKVTFWGSIIDAPCSITPDTIDQRVPMGQISNKALANGGKSNPRTFSIKLENCDVSALTDKTVTTTFSGVESSALPGYLAIAGTASGASIGITADNGANIKLGDPAPVAKIQEGNNTLQFAAYLQGNGATAAVVPGDFEAVANFTLAYQ